MANTEHHPVLLFDGVCNLCSGIVQFVIERDPDGIFHFASLQSEAGQALLNEHDLPVDDFDSFVLIENGQAYQRSTAALRVVRQFPWPWKAGYPFIFLPAFLRDPFYNIIARRRYRWFGKQEQCMIPSPEIASRFL